MIEGIVIVGLVIALCVMVEREHARKRDARIKELQERKYPAWPS